MDEKNWDRRPTKLEREPRRDATRPRHKRTSTSNVLVQLDDEVALRLRLWAHQRNELLWVIVQDALLRCGLPTIKQLEAARQAAFLRD